MMRPAPTRYRRKSSVSTTSKAYPRPAPPRQRTVLYTIIVAFIFVCILFYASPSVPVIQDLRLFHHTPTHKPPAQKNSTSGDTKWYSDWKWLNPFSATITLEEDRSVLPPLPQRPPIYTFYDADAEKGEKTKTAENKLLLLWRRAWWAQGFKPVILGRPEAMNNPLYESFQVHKLQPQLEAEFVRWLAWGHMGTGILANWLAVPMGPHDDHLLTYLRRGEYPKLTRYEGLGPGLFSGEKNAINAVIEEALKSPKLEQSRSLLDLVEHSAVTVEHKPDAIAFYDANANAEHYKAITTMLADEKAAGLQALAKLITSHLHLTFLNTFKDGFAVLTPYSDNAHILTEHALSLADTLRSCPSSPVPSSCPPNRQDCTPCSSISPPPVKMPEYFTNSSTVYTIGTVPHPFTLASLLASKKEITTRHIRRDTARDRWLTAVTENALGKEVGGASRVVSLKEIVAGEWGCARGLWITEDPPPNHKDLEYHFGFELSPFNVTARDPDTLPGSRAERKAAARTLHLQKDLLANAKEVLKERRADDEKTRTKQMVEAWNLADTEAWRFVRAYMAREGVERNKWEEEERAFAGAEEGRAEGWGSWFDRRLRRDWIEGRE
ncbi:hypothetical protein JMJ35_003493 [Cladonia borealis]|uniref:Uncharacterized protein n=1 Tax=Cladonia borealis TaxID=184061 RepID=A0AA39R5D5_9LECA|nr:hypothetical protein JMJ35_003493 [Cladonia borealis]